jgi:hypothetical protein
MNGGACTDGVASFSCECADGFDGSICSEIVVVPYQPTIDVYASQALNTAPYDPVAGHTTYRLRLQFAPHMASVHAMYGTHTNLPHVPAAYFNTYAMGGGVEPPDPQFQDFADLAGEPGFMLSSFLALGPDTSDTAGNLGTVGNAITGWAAGGPLTLGVNPGANNVDFAFYWTDPMESTEATYTAVGGPLIAQLTLPSDQPFFVKLGLQGKYTDPALHLEVWDEPSVIWMHAIDGVCPAGMTGEGCMTDVDECANAGCSEECWNGIDEYACLCAIDFSTGCG